MQPLNQVLLKEDIRVGADLAAWLARGGGEGLAAALRDPNAIIPTLAEAGLRGMGGAGFPTHLKWTPVAAADAADKFVVCNGNEDEPGTFKDRFLLEHTPHQVIEGALIAAVATRANHVVLYVNPHELQAVPAVEQAVRQWQENPLLAGMGRGGGRPGTLTVWLS